MGVWISNKKKPKLYQRLNIKDKNGREYIGFYIGFNTYLTSKGKDVIKNVYKWKIYEGKKKIFGFDDYEIERNYDARLGDDSGANKRKDR